MDLLLKENEDLIKCATISRKLLHNNIGREENVLRELRDRKGQLCANHVTRFMYLLPNRQKDICAAFCQTQTL